jgi:hypothetical protein
MLPEDYTGTGHLLDRVDLWRSFGYTRQAEAEKSVGITDGGFLAVVASMMQRIVVQVSAWRAI